MPTPAALERFIATVESNAHDRAIDEFYAEHATMQENQSAPRAGGKAAHLARERGVMARAKAMSTECIRPVLVHGDTVVIRWIFQFEWLDGTVTRMEELAYQRWSGDQIVSETFFYDPAQRTPVAKGSADPASKAAAP
ncbi:MAG: nuclear transport factor 2 family protein [Deltaproteobacteria bacterium]|nr:nuclear transport factor 2 family protein [Deltaproteobacteria bacterium]